MFTYNIKWELWETLGKRKRKRNVDQIRMMKLLVGQMYINDEFVFWPANFLKIATCSWNMHCMLHFGTFLFIQFELHQFSLLFR